jgi:hypothetical protein
MTGIGPVPVKVPRVRDRGAGDDKITFTPSILPRYLRKARSVEELLPWLYLKGVSTGDFTEALEALLGPNAKGLSAKTVTRLKADWWKDYEAWQKRDLGSRRFLYIWADGVYFKPRMAEEKQCVLVIVGADEYGRKELLAMTDGFRESTQSWRELLLDLKRRGLKQDPKLAIGDGALGFWTALREVFATTREQRCWVHKTMNVLNALPKSLQAKAKGHLHDIWQAETKAEANVAFDFFVATYGVKWDKAVAKLVKDRDALLTFYDYPAEHWKHIRTSVPAGVRRPHTWLPLVGGSPCGNEVLVALFGMFGDPRLLLAQFLHVVGIARAALVALLLRLAGGQFHGAALVGDQAWPGPADSPRLRQHVPAQGGELARHRHGGDLMTARARMRMKKARSGPGAFAAAQAASTSIARAWLRPALLMRP